MSGAQARARPKIICPECGRICAAISVAEGRDSNGKKVGELLGWRPHAHGREYWRDAKTLTGFCPGSYQLGPLATTEELERITRRRLAQRVAREVDGLMKNYGEYGAWEIWLELGKRLGEI